MTARARLRVVVVGRIVVGVLCPSGWGRWAGGRVGGALVSEGVGELAAEPLVVFVEFADALVGRLEPGGQ